MALIGVQQVLQIADSRRLRRVLMVTALPDEMRAVRGQLEHLGSCAGRDQTIYECGVFSGLGHAWLVVVGESGAGTHAAHSVVTNAHVDFPGFELVLFVGIAATRKSEIPLGSVIAASDVYWPYSGKYSNGGFSARPRAYQIDHRLVSFAKKVARDDQWQNRIKPLLGRQLPSQSEYPQPFPPGSFVAPIVTVESVSGDPDSELEQLIAQHYGDAHALEMEGYGAIYAAEHERTPAIEIRGISDRRSGKTPEVDKILQPVAAMHAAAFAFELLDLWGQVQQPVEVKSGNATQAMALPEQSTSDSTTLVLNLEGSLDDYPPPRITQIVSHLIKVTRNAGIKLIKVVRGSVRLFIEAGASDLAKIRDAKADLSSKHEVPLLGICEIDEYERIQQFDREFRLASAELLEWPQTLPDGTWIERPELAHLLAAPSSQDAKVTVITGAPGSGKSALLAQLGQQLQGTLPVLAIKADFIDRTVDDEESLRKYLKMSVLPSEALQRLSEFGPVFLLIDQLDALASYVDMQTGRLSTLLSLVRKIGNRPNVYVVLSARSFEYEHDVRLKSVRAANLYLSLPPWSEVLKVLERCGAAAANWPEDAQQLMRSPQALHIFLTLHAAKEISEPFVTYQEMLERLWDRNVLNRSNGALLARLISEIAENMAEKETLWLPKARFDARISEIENLISVGILIASDSAKIKFGFSHQTIFEHALARSFVQNERSLYEFVLAREASLFIRPKLWAALVYVRNVDPITYASELRQIWAIQNLRRHLRILLIEFMGSQNEPMPIEVQCMGAALVLIEDRAIAFRSIVGSRGWFTLFADTILASAMVDGPGPASWAAGVLGVACRFAGEKVVELIRSHWLPKSDLDHLTWSVIQTCEVWTKSVTELAVAVLRRTNVNTYVIDHVISTVGATHPAFALELVAAKFDFDFYRARIASDELKAQRSEADAELAAFRTPAKPFSDLLENAHSWTFLEDLAERNAAAFLGTLWPWYVQVFEAISNSLPSAPSALHFPLQYNLDLRLPGEHTLGLPEGSLLGAVRKALEVFARSDEDFPNWLLVHEHENYAPAQRLIAHAMTVDAEQCAALALTFLMADSRRFWLGSIEDYCSTSKRLIKMTSPFWGDADLLSFENYVLGYNPKAPVGSDANGRRIFRQGIRIVKFGLLSALPAARISPNSVTFLREQGRQSKVQKLGTTFSGVTAVGASMSAQEMAKATDADIMNAFRTFPDATDWSHPKYFGIGGNIQLSREFATFAKNNMDRALALIGQFTPEMGTRAAGYALDSIAEIATPRVIAENVAQLSQRGFDGEEFRSSISRAVDRLLRRRLEIPDSLVAVLESWLRSTPIQTDSNDDQSAKAPVPSEMDGMDAKKEEHFSSMLWGLAGSMMLPGGSYPTAEALSRIYLARGLHDVVLRLLTEHLSREKDERIWAALLHLLRYVRPASNVTLSDFLNLLFQTFPRLLDRRDTVILLADVRWRVPEFVEAVVRRWKDLGSPALQQAAGELAALIVVTQPSTTWAVEFLKETLEVGNDSIRAGVAYSSAHLWPESEFQPRCALFLTDLIPDAQPKTWHAIFDLFRINNEIAPSESWIKVLTALAKHIRKAQGINHTFVPERLATLLPHEPVLVYEIARGLVLNSQANSNSSGFTLSLSASALVDIAITLHRLGPETRNLGTSLFELLLEMNAYSARSTLDEIDHRRFANANSPVQPRLTRQGGKRRV